MKPVDFNEVVAALQARPLQVAQVYAPGGHVEGGRYWALNPGRGDRRIGSFHVGLTGHWCGRWRDEATGEGGDMLDLIQMALRLDRKGALEEAMRFLGMGEETPAQRELRRRQDEVAAAQRAADAEKAEAEAIQRRKKALSLWLKCHAKIADTPVAEYLTRRGIGIERLGREPHAIRYHPGLRYEHIDKDTGEVFEGVYPAMVTAISGPYVAGQEAAFWGAHRTWLARGKDGRWGKAPVPVPKKVLGSVKGGYIRVWTGMGPRGGKGAPLAQAKAGEKVYITEGIEDALSVAVLKPEVRVFAAVSLGNMRELVLPPQVGALVLVRDNDKDEKNIAQIWRAKERFLIEGRAVGVWPESREGFYGEKDLNALLMASIAAEEGA